MTENEAIAKDGRLHVGDFVVRINDESLRRVTNAQARAILRRSSVLSSCVTYVKPSSCLFHLVLTAAPLPELSQRYLSLWLSGLSEPQLPAGPYWLMTCDGCWCLGL